MTLDEGGPSEVGSGLSGVRPGDDGEGHRRCGPSTRLPTTKRVVRGRVTQTNYLTLSVPPPKPCVKYLICLLLHSVWTYPRRSTTSSWMTTTVSIDLSSSTFIPIRYEILWVCTMRHVVLTLRYGKWVCSLCGFRFYDLMDVGDLRR